jgi:hypothetical protein
MISGTYLKLKIIKLLGIFSSENIANIIMDDVIAKI